MSASKWLRINLILLFFVLIAALAGCSTVPKVEVVTKSIKEPVTIPKHLLVKCNITPPPNVETYVNSSIEKREDMLTDTVVSLYQDLGNCNDQIEEIGKFQDRQVKLILEFNNEVNAKFESKYGKR